MARGGGVWNARLMAPRARLDAELVRRGLARSRLQARELIETGRVTVNGTVAVKPATNVGRDTPLVVRSEDSDNWASRGAHKLLGALDGFAPRGLTVTGRRCLDAGASTGGFTDVLLDRGAGHVVAVDVGYGQLVWRLQTDDRVTVVDRTNARHLSAEMIGGHVDLVVADLSFISLSLVLPAFVRCAGAGADLLPMVKPQFEVGKERVGGGGVVRDPRARADAVTHVAGEARRLGLVTKGVIASPLPGPSGNVEYFLWLTNVGGAPDSPPYDECGESRGPGSYRLIDDDSGDLGAMLDSSVTDMIELAVREGPQ